MVGIGADGAPLDDRSHVAGTDESHIAQAKYPKNRKSSKGYKRHKTFHIVCAYCGKEADVKAPNGRFCSTRCNSAFFNRQRIEAQEAKRKATILVCANCGKQFTPAHLGRKQGQRAFCSKECYIASHRTERSNYIHRKHNIPLDKPIEVEKVCPICGEVFTTNRLQKVYCSRKCYIKRRNNKRPRHEVTKTCVFCGRDFSTIHTKKLCCSAECDRMRLREKARAESKSVLTGVSRDGRKYTNVVPIAERDAYLVTERICPNCGKKFVPHSIRQYCCCVKCSGAMLAKKKAESRKLPLRKCEVCGKEYQPHRKRQRFCSKECYKKYAWSKLRTYRDKRRDNNYVPLSSKVRVCVICGKQFAPKRSHQKCCSHECSAKNYALVNAKYRRGGGITPFIDCVCVVCGKPFKAISKKNKYCSHECRFSAYQLRREEEFRANNPQRKCLTCGKEFLPTLPSQVCCSEECSRLRVEKFGKGKRDVTLVHEKNVELERLAFIESVARKREEEKPLFDRIDEMPPEEKQAAIASLSARQRDEYRKHYMRKHEIRGGAGISFATIHGRCQRASIDELVKASAEGTRFSDFNDRARLSEGEGQLAESQSSLQVEGDRHSMADESEDAENSFFGSLLTDADAGIYGTSMEDGF